MPVNCCIKKMVRVLKMLFLKWCGPSSVSGWFTIHISLFHCSRCCSINHALLWFPSTLLLLSLGRMNNLHPKHLLHAPLHQEHVVKDMEAKKPFVRLPCSGAENVCCWDPTCGGLVAIMSADLGGAAKLRCSILSLACFLRLMPAGC